MRLGKDLVGKQIISVSEGRQVGTVKDLYLDQALEGITGIFVGSEGLFSRKSLLIQRDHIVLFGVDVILVQASDVVTDSNEVAEAFTKWVRREKVIDREVDTPGGTKVAKIGDILLDEEARVVGFSLGRVFVAGPVAEQKVFGREAMLDTGSEDGAMTIDLSIAEKQKLAIV